MPSYQVGKSNSRAAKAIALLIKSHKKGDFLKDSKGNVIKDIDGESFKMINKGASDQLSQPENQKAIFYVGFNISIY